MHLFTARGLCMRFKWHDIVLSFLFVLVAAFWVVSGFSEVLWMNVPGTGQQIVRFILLTVSVIVFIQLIRAWTRLHARSIGTAEIAPPEFTTIPPSELFIDFTNNSFAAQFTSHQVAALQEHLVYPAGSRSRVEEQTSIAATTVTTQVSMTLSQSPFALAHEDLLLVTRVTKAQGFGSLTITCDGVEAFPIPLADSNALVFRVALTAITLAPRTAFLTPAEETEVLELLCELIAGKEPPSTSRDRLDMLLDTVRADHNTPNQIAVATFLDTIQTKRATFILAPHGGPQRTIVYTFIRGVTSIDLDDSQDWWRRVRDRLRSRVGLPSRYVSLSLGRAFNCEHYRLHVTIPDGLYIDESYVMAGSDQLGNLERHYPRRAHVSWSRPNGRSDLRLQTWRLNAVQSLSPDIVLFFRMIEKPPGTILPATIVASAVAVLTWLSGVVLGSQLRLDDMMRTGAMGGEENVAPGVDIAALTITLPGVAASLLSLSLVSNGSYRSIFAVVVNALSLVVSVSSLILYVGRSALVKFDDYLFQPAGRSFYFLQDTLSSVVFVVAIANVAIATAVLVSGFERARRLRAGGAS